MLWVILSIAIISLACGYLVYYIVNVGWVPTPQTLLETMLDMAKVTPSDYVIDLGSGDGRVVIAAAKRGATALGIEHNPDLVELARRAAAKAGVSARATFEKADIFENNFSKATVVILFLNSRINLKLRPKILDMKPGTRIVSNNFAMADWQPDKTTHLGHFSVLPDAYMTSNEESRSIWRTAHLWTVPATVGGTWKMDNGTISFTQEFQNITGNLTMGTEDTELTGKLDGDKISFSAGGTEYTGKVSGNTISGTCAEGGSWQLTR
jgi:hypothetical protein